MNQQFIVPGGVQVNSIMVQGGMGQQVKVCGGGGEDQVRGGPPPFPQLPPWTERKHYENINPHYT